MYSQLRRQWVRWNLSFSRNVRAQNSLNTLYLVNDPWNLRSADETRRFEETNRIIQEKIGVHFRKILEIGCGEGTQTQHLARLTDLIVGVEPSMRALKRAQQAGIPNAQFEKGDIFDYDCPEERYCLITACEVLYYLPPEQLEPAFRRMSVSGRACFASYHNGAADKLEPFFNAKHLQPLEIAGRWKAVWWRTSAD